MSYPLPGTDFYEQVRAQLGRQRNWKDTGDLAMLFQGTYDTAFYRRLHRLLHRELELRHRARQHVSISDDPNALEAVQEEWTDLINHAERHLTTAPTPLPST